MLADRRSPNKGRWGPVRWHRETLVRVETAGRHRDLLEPLRADAPTIAGIAANRHVSWEGVAAGHESPHDANRCISAAGSDVGCPAAEWQWRRSCGSRPGDPPEGLVSGFDREDEKTNMGKT